MYFITFKSGFYPKPSVADLIAIVLLLICTNMKLISLVKIYAGSVIGELKYHLFWCWERKKSVTSKVNLSVSRAANTEILTHVSIIICLHLVCGTEYLIATHMHFLQNPAAHELELCLSLQFLL